MQPIWIFSKNEELVAALGDACPYYDATLTETIDSVDRLEFSIPGDHPSAANVVPGCIAVIETPEGPFRAFRIVTQRQGFGEDGIRYCQFYCEDIAIDELNAAPVIDRRPNNPLDALIGALENSLWEVGQVDGGFPEGSTNFYHESAMSALKKIAETWGGEFRFRIEHDGRRITGRYVDFLQQRGADNGVRVTVGKNMRSLEGETDITGLATALYGYGRGEEHDETGGFGRRISFADVEWKVENGDPVDKPLGQEWVGDPQALAAWGLQGGTVHRFGFVVFEDVEDPAELLRLTWEELQRRKAPQVNYKVGMVDLERTEGRSHEAVRVGDWVTAIEDDFKPPLEFKARVIEKKTPLREPEKAEITLGQVQPTLTDVIDKVERAADQAIKVGDPINLLDSVFETLTDELHTTPGYVYITPTDGLLVTDKPKDQHPTSAIQLKGGMLAIADEWDVAKGDFNWRAFGTGSGFTADLITAGTLDASLVRIYSTATDGDEPRELTLYDGRVTSYFDGQKTIEMGGSNLFVWPYLPDSGGTGEDMSGAVYGVRWRESPITDGIAMTGRHFVGLGLMRPDESADPILVADKNRKGTLLAGPASASAADLATLSLQADSRLAADGTNQPGIWVGRGNVNSTPVANVEVYIGDPTRSGVGGGFYVFRNTSTTNRAQLLQVTPSGYSLNLQNTSNGAMFLDNSNASIGRDSSSIFIAASTDDFIAMNKSNGEIAFVMNGNVRHYFYNNGSKDGGSIEIDGRVWGMSPMDSPRSLISDIMFGVDVVEEGTVIELDERLGKALATYTVFANKPVEISNIEKFSFKVSGYTGKVDLFILGPRVDDAEKYFTDLGAKNIPTLPIAPAQPEEAKKMKAVQTMAAEEPEKPRPVFGEMAPAEVIKKRRAQNEKTR